MSGAEKHANAEERQRIERFRSNALRRTRVYHSEPTHFHFPELREREFHPRSALPWLERTRGGDRRDRAKSSRRSWPRSAPSWCLTSNMRSISRSISGASSTAIRDWTAIHLIRNGDRVEANARHCPRTMALLERLPQPRVPGAGPNAMFSLLAPHTHIPAHVGVSNARLVCHLPLVIPDGCWFRVGAETRTWSPGEALVFDDTIEHEAMNDSDSLRVVFIFDVWHPDLTAVERDAVAALIASEGGAEGL